MNIFYFKIFLLCVLTVLAAVIAKTVLNKNTVKEFSFEKLKTKEELKKDKKPIRLFFPEKIIFTVLKIKDPSRVIVYIERLSIVLICIIAGYMLNYLAIYFIFEIFVYFYTKNKEKEVEDRNGLSYIPKTNSFLDMYIPAVNNGESVNQIMNRFVDQEKDPELTKWWFSEDKENEEIPLAWNDVIKIYQNGYYNEQNGYQDSSDVYQRDLTMQQTYYNNFKEKIGEISPIKMSYYIFMPIVLMISWVNDKAFWGSIIGLIDVIFLCGLLVLFSFLLHNLHKETCEKLF